MYKYNLTKSIFLFPTIAKSYTELMYSAKLPIISIVDK